jgi:hypothetical protein
VKLAGPRQKVAYDHWFEQAGVRQEGRRGRPGDASPFVPPVVWLVMVLAGAS